MRHALYAPNFGTFGDVKQLVEFAKAAEEAGWDGFFLWDHLRTIDLPATDPFVDPWIAMTAMACSTTHLKFGALVTPLSRRRPWKVARETATLDRLSDGRLVLGAGIGGDFYREFSGFGEEVGNKLHAEKLDEALQMLDELWSGEETSFKGKHYQLTDIQFHPTPVQKPRIPVWLAGVWPGTKPFQRAAKWDGIFPLYRKDGEFPAEEVSTMLAYINEYRTAGTPFDVVIVTRTHKPGNTDPVPTDEYLQRLSDLKTAGVTWSLQSLDMKADIDEVMAVIKQGPPR